MLQLRSMLVVADNTGAKKASMIGLPNKGIKDTPILVTLSASPLKKHFPMLK